MSEEKIDIVYTWCDGIDPVFQKQRKELCERLGIAVKSNDDQLDENKRYIQHNELLYSLRSVEKYAPWVNHIFIVTNKQRPRWLKNCEKITVIDQNDIIPKEITPVFNSVTIEQYIIRIPNLSERFLYLCDDMFFNRKVKPNDFFVHMKPIVWIYDCSYFDFNQGAWEETILNAYGLFCKKNKEYYPFFSPHHGIDSYSKTMLKEIFDKYPETYALNSSPFRNSSNIQRILWAYEMAYKYNCPVKKGFSCIKNKIVKVILFFIRRNAFWNIVYSPNSSFKRFKLLLALKNCYSFCINNLSDEKSEEVIAYLEKRFPKKSNFEI